MRSANYKNLKLRFLGVTPDAKNYGIELNNERVGEFEFLIDSEGIIHVFNIVTHMSLGLWLFFKRFDTLVVYRVTDDKALGYWHRLGAVVVSVSAPQRFKPIVIEAHELENDNEQV